MRIQLTVVILAVTAAVAHAEHSFSISVWTSEGTNTTQLATVPNVDLSFTLNTNEFKAGDSLILSGTVSNNGTKAVHITDVYLDLSSCWSHVDWTRTKKPEPFVLQTGSVHTVKCRYAVPDRITVGEISKRPKDYIDQVVEKMMKESGTPLEPNPPSFHFDTMLIMKLREDEKAKWYLIKVNLCNVRVRQ